MLSEEQRRAPTTLIAHLGQVRRLAISRGIAWFWFFNWLVISFLWIRYEVYHQAGLTKNPGQPWYFQSEVALIALILMLLPIIAWCSKSLENVKWRLLTITCVTCWGGVWSVHVYAVGLVELQSGMSYANGIMRLNLLAALIAFYPDRRMFYGYLLVPIIFSFGRLLWFSVDFPLLYLLDTFCTLLALEVGRRMLNRWFELAAIREYDNLALLRRLDALAKQDPLTGLANRRHFNIELERCRAHSQSSGAPLALILIDVDYFKRFNDHYGHQAGDVCLREVAQQMMRSVRSEVDLAARYGGEEFVLLLPDADVQSAVAIAQRLQDGLAELQLEHLASEVAKRVTISQGIALLALGESGEQLLERADQALYRAKELGRNQFCVAE